MPAIFISYRRADSASAAGRIDDQLVARFGRANVFKDVDSIPPGVNFEQYIEDAIQRSTVALVIIGPRWLNATSGVFRRRLDDPADFVRIEIETALRLGVPIIPLLVDGAAMPSAARLPASLRPLASVNALPVRPDPDFHRDMERVTAAVERLMAGPPPAPPTPPEPTPSQTPALPEAPDPLPIHQRQDEPAVLAAPPAAPPLSPQGEGAGGEALSLAQRIGAKPSRRAPGTLVATISALALIAVATTTLLLSSKGLGFLGASALFANPSATATARSGAATAQAFARTVYATETAQALQLAQPYKPDGVGPCDTKDARYSDASPDYWDWSKTNVECFAHVARITGNGTLDFYGRPADFPRMFTATFTLSLHSSSSNASCIYLYLNAGQGAGTSICDNGTWSSYWPPMGHQENQCCISTAGTLTLSVIVNARTVTITINDHKLLDQKDDGGPTTSISIQGVAIASGAWVDISGFTLTPNL